MKFCTFIRVPMPMIWEKQLTLWHPFCYKLVTVFFRNSNFESPRVKNDRSAGRSLPLKFLKNSGDENECTQKRLVPSFFNFWGRAFICQSLITTVSVCVALTRRLFLCCSEYSHSLQRLVVAEERGSSKIKHSIF